MTATVQILVVDDFERWHRVVESMFERHPELQLVGHASDGEDAVREAQRLQPDLILMDIGLPTLNGIEAARRLRDLAPQSKILFVRETRSGDIVQAALDAGGGGFVIKSDAGSELLPAVRAVLEGRRFISASLAGHFLVAATMTASQALLWLAMLISGLS